MGCDELQNPLIYAELVAGGCRPFQRIARWVVSGGDGLRLDSLFANQSGE
jgi:hypothetical protein